MDFKFNNDEESKAYLYVVDQQNEDIILGMDWLEKEDIIIQAKNKKISKRIQVEMNNSTDLVVAKILEKVPNLTSETTVQNKTTAPYEHSINTGEENLSLPETFAGHQQKMQL
ncbi:hypothetical protein [Parasitella parasitica]|uniref:Uncharacterized protein n=1 Tax=Parasitella parasitica TaxID=35722 RepID=A0A0B7MUE5_9FUNG|nr:hypothetical protein [Parasitella parasitica]